MENGLERPNVDVLIMTTDEAIDWENRLGESHNKFRIVLEEGYTKQAWKSLGYSNFTEHLEVLAERFNFSRTHAFRLHSANQNEKLVTLGLLGDIPEKILRPLSSLKDNEDKQEAWQQAVQSSNGQPTAKQAVRQKPDKT